MEQQGGCWMWGNRKYTLSALGSATNPSYDDDSWEEQAFAEDAAENLGGCTWPPRFYSCSFFKKEFQSAQALGGHMNVHRSYRARLKQSLGDPQDEIAHHDLQIHHQNSIESPFSTLSNLCPSQVCGLTYSINPDSDPTVVTSSSSSSAEPSAVSAPPTADILFDYNLLPPYTSIARENCKMYPIHSTKLCTPLAEEKNMVSHDKFNPKNDSQKVLKMLDAGFGAKETYLTTDSAVSLNWVVRRAQPTLLCETEKESTLKYKKRRIDSSIPFFIKSRSVERHHSYPKVFEMRPSPIKELDLELRLGDRPKVQ